MLTAARDAAADAPGLRHDEAMQLEEDAETGGARHSSSAHIATMLKMESAHLDYDERDKGDYDPAPRRTRTRADRRDDNVDFYDERRRSPTPKRHQNATVRRNRRRSRSEARGRDRSRSRSEARGRDRSRSRSRSPRWSHRHSIGRSRSRSRSRSRDRSRTRRHERSPRGRRSSNARDSRGPVQPRRGGRPGGRNGGHDYAYDQGRSPPYRDRRHSGGGGRSFPEPAPRDLARAKKDLTQEERKRGQRLFGGLLANLGGPAAKPRSAARLGAAGQRGERASGAAGGAPSSAPGGAPGEQPAADAADHEHPDDSSKTAGRLAKLDRIRRIEQVRFDEQKMHSLQASDLALARSLRTASVPQLHYRPRLLSDAQEKVIQDQLQDAERRASQQSREFENEKLERLSALGVRYTPKSMATSDGPPGTPQRDPDAMVDEPAAEHAGGTSASLEVPGPQTDGQQDGQQDCGQEHQRGDPQSMDDKAHLEPEAPPSNSHFDDGLDDNHDERDKDIMVETEEDTVIY